jgi:hypothetical protein
MSGYDKTIEIIYRYGSGNLSLNSPIFWKNDLIQKATPHARPLSHNQIQSSTKNTKTFNDKQYEICILGAIIKMCFWEVKEGKKPSIHTIEEKNSVRAFAKKFNEKLCQMLDEFNQKVEQRTLPDAPGSKPVFGKSKEVRYEFPYEFHKWYAVLNKTEKSKVSNSWCNCFSGLKDHPSRIWNSPLWQEYIDTRIHSKIIFLEDFKEIWLGLYYGIYGYT